MLPNFAYENITTAASTLVKTGTGVLHGITINTPVSSSSITIYDGTSASGTKIGTITLGSTINDSGQRMLLEYDVVFGVGLFIVTTGTNDLTVSYY